LADILGMVVVAKLNKVDEVVVSTLKSAGKGLTLKEIAEKSGETEKKIFKSLRKLFENELINCENHHYRLTNP
jgi:predicted transcriptional regulator